MRGAHTALDEFIRVVNVTRVWQQWRKPVLILVARDVPECYAYLREAFRDVPWAQVVIDRRLRVWEEGQPPWAIVRSDRIEVEAPPARASWIDTLGLVRLFRWTWNTGWKIGEYAAYQTLPLGRG